MTSDGIVIRPVEAKDWSWIEEWATDPVLDEELGPIDREWFNYVLSTDTGPELVVLRRTQPIALVGILWGNEGHGRHTITDFAVNPSNRRAGIGRTALIRVLDWVNAPQDQEWEAWVSKGNIPAIGFFTQLGWVRGDTVDEMISFTYSAMMKL